MEGRVTAWVAMPPLLLLLLQLTATAVTASPATTGASDPCARHTCRPGEECVVHEVKCQQRPCPRIGECRVADCALSCRPGFECVRQPLPCVVAPCPTRERCMPVRDACDGRCQPQHEVCLSRVQPCRQPPCPTESACLPRTAVLTARSQPPPPSFCQDCVAPAVCVPTQVCRQHNECLFLPVCLSNCTSMWCGQGHVCRMQRQPCEQGTCPLQPACVPDTDAEPEHSLGLEIGNRFNARPAVAAAGQPRCVVPCSPDEECQQTAGRCAAAPCPAVWRCRPRGAPADLAGQCPLDDLRELASQDFCDVSLHQCQEDDHCGPQRRCCARGCGNTCLPVCRPGCAPGTECRLVEVQCIGSPCPKVAQCVAVEVPPQPEALPLSPTKAEASHQSRPGPPPQPSFQASLGGSSSSSSAAGSGIAADEFPASRPGLCPVNSRQTQSIICFDNGSVDKCASDDSCPAGQRCCLRGCQRLCRPVCASCAAGQQCRQQRPGQPPVCGPPVNTTDPRRHRRPRPQKRP